MMQARHSLALVFACAVTALPASAAAPKPSPSPAPAAGDITGLPFRNIGPAIMGGRIDDFAVVEGRPATFYVATASGGVWKTINNGTTFEPIFDDQPVSTIGDITLAPSDPQILYVGTGEPNNRQSSSWGNGVYKTTDGGASWTHLGLADSHHIGRMAVHPTRPEIVYVAALGHLWGPNKERGLFRSTDGGKTWTNTKFIDEDTGFVDVAMDPESPSTLYAASYQRRRAPFGYSGGGPGSALWKTTDGGETWTKMTNGLPTEGDLGRSAVGIYRKDPRIVYALVEHAKQGGIYRSDDRGATWKKMSDTNPRPSYYSKVHVDPNNDQRVYVLGAQLFYSEDGGKTFRTDLAQKIHGDYHAFWIDPADSNHILAGTDGGIHLSYDRGRSWDYLNTIPLAQFYEVHYDMQTPYRVCGGLQDNGSWCGPARTLFQQGISNEDWVRVGGGDGFFVVIDPVDANTVYGESQDGNLYRVDVRTGERRIIRPLDPEGGRHRFNWNSPVVISPHDHNTVYYGGNRVFGSTDRGDTWSVVSDDVTTRPDRDAMTIFGKSAKDFMSRNDGVVHFGTITTLAESPVKAGILWAGTDDGVVSVSRDGGRTFTRLSLPSGVPAGTYVSRVEPSRTGEGTAYLSFDGHRGNDFRAYLFRTDDFGKTWRSISGNIPAGGTVSVVREHPKNPSALFVGTEYGLWASTDAGSTWRRVKGSLPTVPIDDIQIHPRDNDLILATHGRGVYVLDHIDALGRLTTEAMASDLHVFEVEPAVQWRIYGHKGNTGHKYMLGPNPPEGALVSYWLKSKPGEKDEVKITVTDASGKVVRELKGPKEAGLNQASWDLRVEPPIRPSEEGGGGGGFFGPPRGPLVAPGTYTVKVASGAASTSRTVSVQEDPRLTLSAGDRTGWEEATRAAARQWGRADAANRTLTALKRDLAAADEAAKKAKAGDDVTKSLAALIQTVDRLAPQVNRQIPLGFAGAPLATEPDPLLPRARGLYLAISSITAPPTAQQRQALERTSRAVDEVVTAVNALVEKQVPEANRLLLEKGVGRVPGGEAIR